VATRLRYDTVVHPILFIIIQKKEVRSEITAKERALKDVLLRLEYAAKKSLRTSHYNLPFPFYRGEEGYMGYHNKDYSPSDGYTW
jgi:hypothetical protein